MGDANGIKKSMINDKRNEQVMKKIVALTMMLVMAVLLLSGCAPSEEKQAKEILAEYFKQREAKLYIDDYEKTGVIEKASVDNKEVMIVNDGVNKNKLYVFEPTINKKNNPVFIVDVRGQEVYQKVLTSREGGVPVYVKVSPLLKEDLVDSAFAKIETETTTELKEEVTKQLEMAKTELYDSAGTSTGNTGASSSSGTSDQTGMSQSESGTSSGSGAGTSSGTSSGSGSSSGSTTQPGSGGTTDPGTSDEDIPTSTLEFYKSLSPGMKIVLVKLDTDKPENYKITYADVTLTYNADFSAYIGDVPTSVAENLDPVKTKR